MPDEPARFRRAVPAAVGRGRGRVRRGLAPARALGGLVAGLRHHRRAVPAHRAAGVPGTTSTAATPTGPTGRRSGTPTSAPRSRRPSWRTARSGRAAGGSLARVRTVHCGHHPPGAAAGLRRAGGATPSDDRYADLVGPRCATPVFGVDVPVLGPRLVEPDKGTGGMVCTFGDLTDVTWWREPVLPTRPVLGPGRAVPGLAAGRGRPGRPYAPLAGLTVFSARQRMAELLAEAGALRGRPRADPAQAWRSTRTAVRPLEIVVEWAVVPAQRRARPRAAGGPARPRAGAALASGPHAGPVRGLGARAGRRLAGQPAAVLRRAGPGLVLDLGDRARSTSTWVLAAGRALPVDPAADVPPGFTADQRDRPGGFTADRDVLDTWATSSLTPWIAGDRWATDQTCSDRVFPLRPAPAGHTRSSVPGCSPRVLRFAPGTGPAALVGRRDLGLGARPGPEEDVQVRAAT